MIQRLKLWVKQHPCNHSQASLTSWKWVRNSMIDKDRIEITYTCPTCGLQPVQYISGQDAYYWDICMGSYKKSEETLHDGK